MMQTKGLGAVVGQMLTSIGITEERIKRWFNVKECGLFKTETNVERIVQKGR